MKKFINSLGFLYNAATIAVTVLFICLKSDDLIDWSWWLVFAPIWASFAVALLLVLAISLIVLFKKVRDEK